MVLNKQSAESNISSASEIHKKPLIRKLLLTFLLLITSLFLLYQRESLADSKLYTLDYGLTDLSSKKVPVNGSGSFQSDFTLAESMRVSGLRLYFRCADTVSLSGSISVTIEDANGTVFHADLDAEYLDKSAGTKLRQGGDSAAVNQKSRIVSEKQHETFRNFSLHSGTAYTITVDYKDIAPEGELKMLSADDGTDSVLVYTRFDYLTIDHRFIVLLTALFLMTLCFIWIPWERIKSPAFSRAVGLCLFLLTPFVCFLLMYKISGKTSTEVVKALFTLRGVINLLLIFMIAWLFLTIAGRMQWASALTLVFIFAFSFTNYLLLLFRDYPLIATDLFTIGTALDVVGSYKVTFNKYSLFAIAVTIAWLCILFRFRSRKGPSLKGRAVYLAVLLAMLFSFYYAFFRTDLIKKNNFFVSGFKPKATYVNNGYLLSFTITFRNLFTEKPDGYSASAVQEIAESYTSDPAAAAPVPAQTTPNIIVIMNESFSDLSVMGDLVTNEDPVPFFHSLKDKAVTGWMHSSVYGGSTADSEFEFLTGFSMQFQPYRSIPYRNMIKEGIPSLTSDLKQLGYTGNIAFHPGMRDSYNRNNVYPAFGFAKHIALEDLKDPECIRDFVSDSQDYKIVEREFEAARSGGKTAPFYMFNVTIQNHGGYQYSTGLIDRGIQIMDTKQMDEEAEQFLNLMKASDDALEELITYFSAVEEPTVILLFGDHQPKLGSSFYSAVAGKKTSEFTTEETERKYKVPFLIWANYDIPKEQDVEISANYLSAYMRSVAGMPLTGYDKFLLDVRKTLPVISAIIIEDKDGNLYEPSDLPDQYHDLVRQYNILQYNGLVDERNRIESFFGYAPADR